MSAKMQAKLLSLLSIAERSFRLLGHDPILSSYRSGIAIADFIASAMIAIQNETLDDETSLELWRIFAPTCDWDDCIGEINTGNDIFEILNSMRKRP